MIFRKRKPGAEGNVDRLIRRKFFKGGTGVFVDVGAARPDWLSISASFRERGWRVIAIEPNPEFCEEYRRRGLEVLQYACGDRDQDDVDFVVVDSHGTEYLDGRVSYESFSSLAIKEGYAALKPDLDKRTIKVSLRKLDTILQTHAPEIAEIDILSLDVEGWELEVLSGLSVGRYRPKVMVIENLLDDPEYRSTLTGLGYGLWRRVMLNEVYVRADLMPV